MWLGEKEILAAKRMRMLRLGAGWSAEKLSQEYRTGGAGELARTTIAKIERDIRPIKAGEVDGVARVFGLTSNDLLGVDGPKVFLSYAEQDASTGQGIAAWLGDHGFQLLAASSTTADDPGSASADARAIDAAQAFVVLLSPSFLSSPRCQQELDLAVRREGQLLAADPDARFIYVLQVTAEADLDDSGLSAHLLIDLSTGSDRSRDRALSKLGGNILSGAPAPEVRTDPLVHLHLPDSPEILARDEELGRVLNALRNSSGASFWVLMSPPGFGKSWLLGELETEAAKPAYGGWTTKMVDLRSPGEAGNGRHDATTLISSLFEIDPRQPSETDDDHLRRAARDGFGNGQSRLCLLDSAELLSADTVTQLRRYLGTIHDRLQDSGREDAHLAFVAASRRDNGWRGITPFPAPSFLRLTGIGPSVVKDALEGLARGIRVVRSPAELRRDAELVHRVTEGMPELVLESLHWIRAEQWLDIDRLNKRSFFGEIIERRLLAGESLLPADDGQSAKSAKQLAAVREGMRVLVPYRFITRSHVIHHVKKDLDNDRPFRDALKEADWQAQDLWQAITWTALLLPLDEPWREIHPAIRRLLYQYFYPRETRAEAHRRAAEFTRYWASQVTGQEQVTGMVESIWHEAVRLRLASDKEMGEKLVRSARALSEGVRESGAYSQAELRDYAVQRMMNDEELRSEVAGEKGLFDRLIGVVADPGDRNA
jgi:transcriptional regulator with XRE-family HTH domain